MSNRCVHLPVLANLFLSCWDVLEWSISGKVIYLAVILDGFKYILQKLDFDFSVCFCINLNFIWI